LAFTRSLLPITQGPRRDAEAAGCVRAGEAESCRSILEVEGHVAGLMLGLTARLLADRTTAARWQGR